MIVGITGYKGSGKDTAASIFEDAGWAHVKFADGLKEMLRALLSLQGFDEWMIDRMIDGDLKEVSSSLLDGCTPRHAMQTLGTEWGREHIGADFWVNVASNSAFSALALGAPGVVISDMRFPNECAWINSVGLAVRINRSGQVSDDAHPSEAQIAGLPVAVEIENDGHDIDAFKARVKDLIQSAE